MAPLDPPQAPPHPQQVLQETLLLESSSHSAGGQVDDDRSIERFSHLHCVPPSTPTSHLTTAPDDTLSIAHTQVNGLVDLYGSLNDHTQPQSLPSMTTASPTIYSESTCSLHDVQELPVSRRSALPTHPNFLRLRSGYPDPQWAGPRYDVHHLRVSQGTAHPPSLSHLTEPWNFEASGSTAHSLGATAKDTNLEMQLAKQPWTSASQPGRGHTFTDYVSDSYAPTIDNEAWLSAEGWQSNQQFPGTSWDPRQEFLSLDSSSAMALQPSPGATLITMQNNANVQQFHFPPQHAEELKIDTPRPRNNNRILNEDVAWRSTPVPSRVRTKVKRQRKPDILKATPRPPKRRARTKAGLILNPHDSPINSNYNVQDGRLHIRPERKAIPVAPEGGVQNQEGPRPRESDTVAFFPNAHDMSFKDVNMIGSQHIYMQNNHSDGGALQWLKEYAMPGAEHNSADRDPPPRCHPGTRMTIIQKVNSWLSDPQRQGEKMFLWLRGTAGVGKSAIIQTLAEILSESGRLGASIFFSRPNGRSNPRQIFPTLARQFAVQDPSYRKYITQLMHADPESLNKAMGEQFRLLIIEPFISKKIRDGSDAWVVALDGLDECGMNKCHSDDVQRNVVRLISEFVQQYPSAPLIWVVASRPETHLKAVFSEPDIISSFWEEEVPVDSKEACEDVEKFLHNEFTKISRKYPDHIRESLWPTHRQFLKIAEAALGLFIFAEVVIRFIEDARVGNPITQLETVLLAILKMRPKRSHKNPLANLDAIYIAVLSKIPPSDLEITKRLLGIFMLVEHRDISYCNFSSICDILDVPEDNAITALRFLHSVLYFPKVKNIGETRPRFYHASFRDFLGDQSRSHEFFVDKQLVVIGSFQTLVLVAQARLSPIKSTQVRILGGLLPPHMSPPERASLARDALWGLFRGEFSEDGVRVQFHRVTCFFPDAKLQSLLEGIDAIRMIIQYLYTNVDLVDDWIHSPNIPQIPRAQKTVSELIRRGFMSLKTLGSLNINWDNVYIRPYAVPQRAHTIQAHLEPPGEMPHNETQAAAEIRHFLTIAPGATQTQVLGHRKTLCYCIIIQRVDHPAWPKYSFHSDSMTHLVFFTTGAVYSPSI